MKGDIVRIQNSDELLKKLRAETDERVKPRLIFLNAMSNHDISYEKASEICGLSLSTGYVWIRKWNAGGYEALKDKETRTGRPPRLNKDDIIKLKEILVGRNYWTTKEVVKEIKTHFRVACRVFCKISGPVSTLIYSSIIDKYFLPVSHSSLISMRMVTPSLRSAPSFGNAPTTLLLLLSSLLILSSPLVVLIFFQCSFGNARWFQMS